MMKFFSPKNIQFVFLASLLFIVYFSIFFIDFGVRSDYSFWSYDKSQNWFGFPETAHLIIIGRPLGALLLNIHFLFLNNISDLVVSRFISFVFILISAYLVYLYLTKRLFLKSFWALALSFCIFTLPSIQLFVIWCTNFIPGSFNIFLVIISYLVLDKAGLDNPFRMRFKLFYLVTAFSIFFSSLFIYPPTALFFLVLTFAYILFSPFSYWQKTRLRAIRDIVFCGLGMSFYFFLNKFIILTRYSGYSKGYLYNFGLTTDFTRSLGTLYECSKVAFGSIWHIILGDKATPIVFLVVLIAAICAFFNLIRNSSTIGNLQAIKSIAGNALQSVVFALFILISSNAPLLLSSGGAFVGYRAMFPYSAIVIMLVFWAIFHISQQFVLKQALIANFMIPLIIISSGMIASENLLITALNNNLELNLVRQRVAYVDLSHVDAVVFIKPFRNSVLIDRKFHFEFNEFKITATNHGFILAFVDGILFENGIKRGTIPIEVIDPEWVKKVVYVNGPTLLIDMNDAQTQKSVYAEYSKEFDIVTVNVSATTSKIHGGLCASEYNNEPESFYSWEAKSFPQWLQIAYSKSKKIMRYELQTEDIKGSPKAWQFQGSNDGIKWIDLDKRTNQKDWRPSEKRIYNLQEPSDYKYYRFIFTEGNSPILRIYEMRIIYNSLPPEEYEGKRVLISNNIYYYPKRVEQGYKGFNIFSYGDNFYGIPQGEGEFFIEKINKKDYYQIFVGKTIEETELLISR